MKVFANSIFVWVWIFFFSALKGVGQEEQLTRQRCVTGDVMEKYFQKHPREKDGFYKTQLSFQQHYEALRIAKKNNPSLRRFDTEVTIPVVVHVVIDNQSLVSDEQIQSQIDVLNADYSGNNADSVNIPTAFKPLFGKGNIRFCLAQRSPSNEPTNGIVRKVSSTKSVPGDNDPIKYSSSGGQDAWDVNKYLNIWVCRMDKKNDLGYSFMPGLPGLAPTDIGLVTAYHAFGTIGSASAPFNKGRTATHEIGHFFNLWHIWGANECVSSCSDSDLVDDTPNQNECTYGTPVFPKMDACSNVAPGIMFMNFMDYVDDAAMCLFTEGQVDRMETALSTLSDRKQLLNSNGCVPVILYSHDAKALDVVSPSYSDLYCQDNTITPRLRIENQGAQAITSIKLNVVIDEGSPSVTAINLNLPALKDTVLTGNGISVSSGYHTIRMYCSEPNGLADELPANDTATGVFSVIGKTNSPLAEGFEASVFPPREWGIANTSDVISYNPVRTTNTAHSGSASVKFDNYNYQLFGKRSILVTPQITIPVNSDSVKIVFWRAAAQYGSLNSDTLEILVSGDCGQNFASVYKKGGAELKTRPGFTEIEFVPNAEDWIADTVDISGWVKGGSYDKVMVQFHNINGYGNNLYLDDINIYSRTLPPRLKEQGFLIAPNPVTGVLHIRHYPTAAGLKGIAVYSSTGQLVWREHYSASPAGDNIAINLSNVASGIYFIKLIYQDKVVVRKILKQ